VKAAESCACVHNGGRQWASAIKAIRGGNNLRILPEWPMMREAIRGHQGGDDLRILPEWPKAHVHAAHRTPERQELFKGAELRSSTSSEEEERAQCVADLLEEELMTGGNQRSSKAIRGHQRQSEEERAQCVADLDEEELMRGAISGTQGQGQGHYLPPLSRGELGDLRGVLCEDRMEECRLELELRAHRLCEHE
jgi:hypothetical protein